MAFTMGFTLLLIGEGCWTWAKPSYRMLAETSRCRIMCALWPTCGADLRAIASDSKAGPMIIDIARTNARAAEDAYLGARDVPSADERRRDESSIRRRT
jgi:hypothetical protein